MRYPVVILGAGPAGLTAAFELVRLGIKPVVLEMGTAAGGLARTVDYKGYLLDVGGHAFYTKISAVERIWKDVLGTDLIDRPHRSSIYYRKRFFRYPVEALDALKGLGILESLRCGSSFIAANVRPPRPETSFETWVSNRFGARLFQIFFKTYAEKVWGMPCIEIHAEWASQRMQELSLWRIVRNAVWPNPKRASQTPNMLVRSFSYPRKGPGMMWTRMQQRIESAGAEIG